MPFARLGSPAANGTEAVDAIDAALAGQSPQ